ncbi:multicopper oxidase family protein [Psychromarinibacter halotolerans]|uniref:Multicopper oxidase family protein n=1 Tax=Psychromarinibacter halotolerans TaxID=1775175 RepID=A0ABV7GVF7_9RHOB|nr:multicopper oxidase family protein [Psychromarinibacter halotolerans]MDF0594569.1 multicopper oxidase family protein [Psychromarinibacter halotolerans]
MKLTRRTFLGSVAATLALPRAGLAAVAELRPAPANLQILPSDYPTTDVWGYGGMPGPEIRLPQGARLDRRLVNGLDQPTTIHWHGLRLPNAMDGVAGMTQDSVAPGGTFDYGFDLKDAGTYWYHPHDRSYEQVGRGLAGALIVTEADAPEVDRDEALVLQDWRMQPDGTMVEDFGALHDMAHAGRIGNYVTANGQSYIERDLPLHGRLRLRLINAAASRVMQIVHAGFTGWTVAEDGHPLETPAALPEMLVLGPGQRMDLIVDVSATGDETAYLGLVEGDSAAVLYEVTPSEAERDAARAAPAPLPPNPLPPLGDLSKARATEVRIEGGAMGRMTAARADGVEMPMQDLVQQGLVWALNGAAGVPDTPIATVSPGETLRMPLINDTAWPHVMHLHGHPFRVIEGDRPGGPWRDSVLVMPGDRTEIAFVAEEPGDWMFHCHMLDHSASGMMHWVKVR